MNKNRLIFCVLLQLVLFGINCFAANIVVYDGGGTAGIQQAMTQLGYSYDLRTSTNPLTLADLATHNVAVIGWNELGDMSGIDPAVLNAGITGKVLLTGHDPDFHKLYGSKPDAAGRFLSQAISWATGSQTGLVALSDFSTAFYYLPSQWGISAAGGLTAQTINSFTAAGLSSGVFNGLTPADMSNWDNSYHAKFTGWGSSFTPFELGAGGSDVVTIGGLVPEPATIGLLGLGALSLIRRKNNKQN